MKLLIILLLMTGCSTVSKVDQEPAPLVSTPAPVEVINNSECTMCTFLYLLISMCVVFYAWRMIKNDDSRSS